VPPDTIKKVAATRGQSVSLADFFLADEMTREGKLAGTDMLLNLYRRPPERNSSPAVRECFANSLLKNTVSASACNKKMHCGEYFLKR
jgi:hypothetical protein